MHKKLLSVLAGLLLFASLHAQTVPTPDHVVLLIMENHSYAEIIGSNTGAPYINSLAADSFGALFTNSLAITHPSQPNYMYLFSGNSQGVLGDLTLASFQLPLTSANLGAELISAGKTFKGYSEDLPSVGFTGDTYLKYARKHAPWVNWQGNSTNGLSPTVAVPLDSFPSNFNNLPTLCWVVPNLNDDMHDGTIAQGDTWVHTHIDAYVQWAKTHNSLLILTFDEDENSTGNSTPITTIFVGQMVKHGTYPETIDHNRVLRTMEDMYGLGYAGASSSQQPITDCWVYKPVSAMAATPLQICPGQSITVTDTSANTPTSWAWSFPGGTPSTATGKIPPAITYAAPGTYNMQLITGNHMGYDTIVKNAYITVNPYPVITVSADTSYVCNGGHATITASGATSLTWLPGSGIISNNGGTLVAGPSANTTYYVTGSSNGCHGDTAAATVVVGEQIIASVTIDASPNDTACYGSTVVHTATTVNGGPSPVYQWKINGSAVGTSTASFSTLVLSPYSIQCAVTSNEQCVSNPNVSSNTLNVGVSNPPTVSWTNGPDTVYVGSGATTLTGGYPTGGTYSGQGVSNNTFYADSLSPGSYTITYTYANAYGCSNTATKTFVLLATSINNTVNDDRTSLYPNPVKNELIIDFHKAVNTTTLPVVYDATGRVIALPVSKQAESYKLDTHLLAPGFYTLKLNLEQNEVIRSFVKQ